MPPEQQPLTGFEAPRGSTETGDWVREGLPVTLSSESGQILASGNAALDCEQFRDWIPLKVGNRWIYRSNTRQITATHFARTIVRTVEVEGFTYYVLDNPETLLRAGIDGRIYQRLAGRDLLLLDPSDAQSVQALLQIEGRSDQAFTPFGLFPESLAYRTTASLRIERGTYVRGLGLLNYSVAVLAGSSGGFSDSVELQEARIAGRVYYRRPVPAISLGVEATDLDIAGRHVTNCAVPCYFAACGFVPGTDPEGTYKPCFHSRVHVEQGPAGTTVEITLAGPSGAAVHIVALQPVDPTDFAHYHQVPLYSASSEPFPAGPYVLRARLMDGSGMERATATERVEIH